MSATDKIVILGGGMAGLTAAAYLAREGLDVELFEQHYRLGGCCTSFRRRKFIFDAAVHAVGGCHEGGILRSVFEDLGVWDRVTMIRANPMDVVISPQYHVPIWVEKERFVEELHKNFPKEIDRLVKLVEFLYNFGPKDFGAWGQATYRNVLDHFLTDDCAKSIFMLPLGNIGISARRAAAIAACTLWRENQLNGGYAPLGSFQVLADVLGARIEELGGKVHKRHEIDRIRVEGDNVVGVHTHAMLEALGSDREIACNYVIGAGGGPDIFNKLIGRERVPHDFLTRLDHLEYSFSGVVVFLGLKSNIHQKLPHHGCHWYLPDPRLDIVEGCLENEWIEPHMFEEVGPFYLALPTGYDPNLAPPGKSTAVIILPAVYKSREFWKAHKERMGDIAVKRLEQLVPGIGQDIEIRYEATSSTIEYFTRNPRGSWYGWAMTPEQSQLRRLGRTGPIKGIYLAGHWTQPGPGVLNAIKSGQMTAKALLRDLKKTTRPSA